MALRVGMGSAVAGAIRHIGQHTQTIGRTLRQLSTGLRIVTAADDPAGLAISERLRSKIRSLETAQRNASDGISAVQIGEAALAETGDLLIRIRELAVQAANATSGPRERSALHQEAMALVDEINRIAATTHMNDVSLLAGGPGVEIQTGTNADEVLRIPSVDASATHLGVNGIDLATGAASARSALAKIDAAIDTTTAQRVDFGVAQSILESRIRVQAASIEAHSAAESRIRDLDYAQATAELTRARILQQMSVSALIQARNIEAETVLALLPRSR